MNHNYAIFKKKSNMNVPKFVCNPCANFGTFWSCVSFKLSPQGSVSGLFFQYQVQALVVRENTVTGQVSVSCWILKKVCCSLSETSSMPTCQTYVHFVLNFEILWFIVNIVNCLIIWMLSVWRRWTSLNFVATNKSPESLYHYRYILYTYELRYNASQIWNRLEFVNNRYICTAWLASGPGLRGQYRKTT